MGGAALRASERWVRLRRGALAVTKRNVVNGQLRLPVVVVELVAVVHINPLVCANHSGGLMKQPTSPRAFHSMAFTLATRSTIGGLATFAYISSL
jgi:hypothetical protein